MFNYKLRKGPCAFEESFWKVDAVSLQCSSPRNDYHCVSDENNRLVELCIQHIWVDPNYCPVYNTGANTLDTVPCNVSTGSCPSTRIWSNEIYKYPVCLNKTYTDDENVSNEVASSTPWIYIGFVVVSLFIVLLAVCLIGHCFRRRRLTRRKDEETLLIDDLEEPFYKTSAFKEGIKFLNEGGNILCLVGRWGSGKTTTAKHIYKAVTNSSPIIISDPLTFDASKHYKPIIMGQAIPKEMSQVEKELIREKVHIMLRNMSSSTTDLKAFIILIINEGGGTVSKFVKSLVTQNTKTKLIDLSKSLTIGDRTQILSSQLKTFCPNTDFSQVEKLALKGKDCSLGYPEICALFCRCSHFQTVGQIMFCNRPLLYLLSYLKTMHLSEDKNKFLIMVYMSLNQMVINVNNQNDMLFEILKSCSCDSTRTETKCGTEQIEITGTEVTGETSCTAEVLYSRNKPKSRDMSREYITSLIPEEFVEKEAQTSVYRLQHDVIKRMTLIVFGTFHFDTLLQLSKPEELKTWIKKKNKTHYMAQGDINPVLEIDGEQWRQYQAKLSW